MNNSAYAQKIKTRLLIGAFVLLIIITIWLITELRLTSLNAEYERLSTEIDRYNALTIEANETAKYLQSDEYVATWARSNGMIKTGEKGYK